MQTDKTRIPNEAPTPSAEVLRRVSELLRTVQHGEIKIILKEGAVVRIDAMRSELVR